MLLLLLLDGGNQGRAVRSVNVGWALEVDAMENLMDKEEK